MPAQPKLPTISVPAAPVAVDGSGALAPSYRRLLDEMAKRLEALETRIRTLEGG